MKCERCNDKEATFYYNSNINGRKTERHLCADCAREEGLGSALDFSADSLFSSPFDMFGDVFSDFFSPSRSLLSAFGNFGLPSGGTMTRRSASPRIVIGEPDYSAAQESSETKIPIDAGEDVKQRRERDALRAQLDAAVKEENFEKAIELRDKLKKLG